MTNVQTNKRILVVVDASITTHLKLNRIEELLSEREGATQGRQTSQYEPSLDTLASDFHRRVAKRLILNRKRRIT